MTFEHVNLKVNDEKIDTIQIDLICIKISVVFYWDILKKYVVLARARHRYATVVGWMSHITIFLE